MEGDNNRIWLKALQQVFTWVYQRCFMQHVTVLCGMPWSLTSTSDMVHKEEDFCLQVHNLLQINQILCQHVNILHMFRTVLPSWRLMYQPNHKERHGHHKWGARLHFYCTTQILCNHYENYKNMTLRITLKNQSNAENWENKGCG